MAKDRKNVDSAEDQPTNPSRRNLLKNAGLVGAAAVSSAGAGNIIAADSPADLRDVLSPVVAREALEVLTAQEAETLEAICDALIPSDEHGPGAKEARAIHYIDRSLASHNSSSRQSYMEGLSAINEYSRHILSKAYHELGRDKQNSILLAVQQNKVDGVSSSFFNMVRSHTIDGTFCDPYYGGNQGFVGWDMLKYPGVRLSTSQADVAQGAQLEPNHQSAYDNITYTKMAANISNSGGSDHA